MKMFPFVAVTVTAGDVRVGNLRAIGDGDGVEGADVGVFVVAVLEADSVGDATLLSAALEGVLQALRISIKTIRTVRRFILFMGRSSGMDSSLSIFN
jgi:hypothetical protein